MNDFYILPYGDSNAFHYAIPVLQQADYMILSAPCKSVTHLLLPVPSFLSDGKIRGGRNLEPLLKELPADITVIGGNLSHPALSGYKTVDLLQDPLYLAKNANITAHCAIRLAMQHLPCILEDCPVLIIGWGRIGKCLAQLLQRLGSNITVAARKQADQAMLQALGYSAISVCEINSDDYKLIFNTVPYMVLPNCTGNALKIDLASQLGVGGEDVLWARGLPGKDAPESSGYLIAQTVLNILRREQPQ